MVADAMVKSRQMVRPLVYWSDTVHPSTICMGCGKKIDFDQEIALVAVQVRLPANPSPEELAGVQRFLLCPSCGTDVDRLVELGIKRIIDLEVEDPSVSSDTDDSGMFQPIPDEKKN